MLKKDFCQNLSKVQIFNHYIIDAFKLLPVSSHPTIARFLNFEFNFSSFCHAWHFWDISLWLVLNGLHKIGLALQCIRFIVYRFFFVKVSLFSQSVFWNPAKTVQEIFDISYCYNYCYCTLIHFWQKFSHNFKKKLIKASQKTGKIMY